MTEFEMASGLQYSVKRSNRISNEDPNKDNFVYKYIQYACTSQRYGDCPSTVSVCHSYGTLRIARYYMIHNHNLDAVERPTRPRITEDFQPPPFVVDSTEFEGTDQRADFLKYVPSRTFSSFVELDKLLNNFQQKTGCLLVKRNSLRFSPSKPEHKTLVYKSITYACCHYGSGRLSNAKINQKTRKMNCPCIIRVGCKAKKLYIMSYVMYHNHPVTAEIAASYPENRRLTENEQKEITDVLLSAPDNLTVKCHIEHRFGKSFSLDDVRQLKYRIKRKKMAEEVVNVCPSDQITHDRDFEMDSAPSMSWNDQKREDYRFAQLEPVADELAEFVCSADHETFCERLELLKDLANAWRNGKQPMLAYSESDLPRDSLGGLMHTEVVKTDDSFPFSKSNRSYLDANL
ncbi:unnamed protein product [Rodentolepis nana]|uniref:FLYWCH-type domain-containing protein n=1 Tax=Rodentolepis nana TaxID=102285 RepID=A0A0R3T356_RODNA|nr:unnamed protein product [Rodentolepis nana]